MQSARSRERWHRERFETEPSAQHLHNLTVLFFGRWLLMLPPLVALGVQSQRLAVGQLSLASWARHVNASHVCLGLNMASTTRQQLLNNTLGTRASHIP